VGALLAAPAGPVIGADGGAPGSAITGFEPNFVVFGADSFAIDDGAAEAGGENCDIAFQLSFSRRLSAPRGMQGTLGDLFGRESPLFFAFTQRAWWDICRDSAPFRETNYAPSLFLKGPLPFAGEGADLLGGFIHQSNGEDGERSIGWNRLFIRARWPFGETLDRIGFATTDRRRWLVDLALWQPVFDGEHDTAIVRAAGYGEVVLAWTPDPDLRVRLALRKGGGPSRAERGRAELDVVFPIRGTDVQGLVRFANGYGTSLERVGTHGYSVRVGVLFSDVGVPSRR